MPNRPSMIPINIVLDENGQPKLPFGYSMGPNPHHPFGVPPFPRPFPPGNRGAVPQNMGPPSFNPNIPPNPFFPIPFPNFGVGLPPPFVPPVPKSEMFGSSVITEPSYPARMGSATSVTSGTRTSYPAMESQTRTVGSCSPPPTPSTNKTVPEKTERPPLWKPKPEPEAKTWEGEQCIDLAESENGEDGEETLKSGVEQMSLGPIFSENPGRNAGNSQRGQFSSESESEKSSENLDDADWSSEEDPVPEPADERRRSSRKADGPRLRSSERDSSSFSGGKSPRRKGPSPFQEEKPPTPGLRRSTRTRKPVVKQSSSSSKEVYHDKEGRMRVQQGFLDLCDCLRRTCPGCHFPCKKCESQKCGIQCRKSRPFAYNSIYEWGRGKIRSI